MEETTGGDDPVNATLVVLDKIEIPPQTPPEGTADTENRTAADAEIVLPENRSMVGLSENLDDLNMAGGAEQAELSKNLGDLKMFVGSKQVKSSREERLVSHMLLLLARDDQMVQTVNELRKMSSAQDCFAWLYMTAVLAKLIPHPDDETEEPGFHAYCRAVKIMLGRRGLVHGWSGEMPNIGYVSRDMVYHEIALRLLWDFNDESDGESSYHSDSPTYNDETDFGFDSDYIPLVEEAVPVDHTSSETNDFSDFYRACDTVISGRLMGLYNAENLQRVKNFNKYLAASNRQRRVRREMRRERRIKRLSLEARSGPPQPVYSLEAKRKEMLAADRAKQKPKYNKTKSLQLRIEKWKWENQINTMRQQQVALPGDLSFPGPGHVQLKAQDVIQFENEMAVENIHKLREHLKVLVMNTWQQYYGHQVKIGATDKLSCWLTPVRFMRQSGPNCGLAVLAMALRPVAVYEVMAGGAMDGGNSTADGTEADPSTAECVQKALELALASTGTDLNRDYVGMVPPATDSKVAGLAELHQAAVSAGYTGRGEMFSARCMAQLGSKYQDGRYLVRLVKRDLLVDTDLSINKMPVLDAEPDNVTATPHGPSWRMSVVDRLMRGYLIAVCFDNGKSMWPVSDKGGTKAHWGLLCGVVVLADEKHLTDDHYFKPPLCLERDADRVWVVARHGKSQRYSLWSLRDLAESNRQLRTPADHIMQNLGNNGINREEQRLQTPGVVQMNKAQSLSPNSPVEVTPAKQPRMESVIVGEKMPEVWAEPQILQGAVAPPAPPPPPPPAPPRVSMMEEESRKDPTAAETADDPKPPYILPDGPRLDLCLARQFVSFEPTNHPILAVDQKVSYRDMITDPFSPLLYYFTHKPDEVHAANRPSSTPNSPA